MELPMRIDAEMQGFKDSRIAPGGGRTVDVLRVGFEPPSTARSKSTFKKAREVIHEGLGSHVQVLTQNACFVEASGSSGESRVASWRLWHPCPRPCVSTVDAIASQ
jgi:hypothetical protein